MALWGTGTGCVTGACVISCSCSFWVSVSRFLFPLIRPLEALIVGGVLALALAFLTVLDSVTSYGEVSAELRVASAVCGDLGSFCSVALA